MIMKKTIILSAILLTATTLVGQVNYIDTTFYSPVLDKEKMVRVYLPPGYNEKLDLHYSVIYYLHGTGGNHTTKINSGHWQPMRVVLTSLIRFGLNQDLPVCTRKTSQALHIITIMKNQGL